MGLYEQKICIFTGLPVEPIIEGRDAIEYLLKIEQRQYIIRLPHYAANWHITSDFFRKNKDTLEALLINDKWFEDQHKIIELEDLEKWIAQADIPRTPKEKLDGLFLKLFSFQDEDGEYIKLKRSAILELRKELYFKSHQELIYYVNYLKEIDLINVHIGSELNQFGVTEDTLHKYKITFKGLNKAIELQESGANSNLCFIAMSFKEETKPVREAIKLAIVKTGFRPIIMDEVNIDSDTTINDAIISNLKKCNFCISDFSYHSNGVYFESGFALGQGKKVIYTCSKSEFANAHFDIKPLQHIIYESTEQLTIDLVNKIEAWIK